MKEMPPFDVEHQKLNGFVQDFISRGNVHKFSGENAFKTHFETNVRSKFDVTQDYWKHKLDHVLDHALFFIFEKDP